MGEKGENTSENKEISGSERGEEGETNRSDLMSEGYRGSGHEENSDQNLRGDTASLNTQNEDLSGNNQVGPLVNSIEATEDLAADAVGLFMDVITDPEKMRALESAPTLIGQFKQLMNSKIPAVDVNRVAAKVTRKRKWSQPLPDLQEESMRLREQAAEKRECANCGMALTGNQIYYCSDDCKSEFYANHPTSVRWNDLRTKALERCGKPAEEVDNIKEIWGGGPEFDLDHLQSHCHECHVLKTNGHQ